MSAEDVIPLFPWTASKHALPDSIVTTLGDTVLLPHECSRRVPADQASSESLARWHRAVEAATAAFALHSQQAGRDAPVAAHATDLEVVRTAGGCALTLPPHGSTAAGFLRALFLVGPEPQALAMWQPHAATNRAAYKSTTLYPGTLWLHHSSMGFHTRPLPNASAAGTIWLRALIWLLPETVRGAKKRRPRPSYRPATLWHTPLVSQRTDALEHLASRLLRSIQRSSEGVAMAMPVSDAESCRPPATRTVLPTPLARADELALEATAARWALPLLASSGSSGSTGSSGSSGSSNSSGSSWAAPVPSSPDEPDEPGEPDERRSSPDPVALRARSALLWSLPPGASLPPQPGAPGLVRVLFVLDAADEDGLRLHLLDPRPPSVRLPSLGRAEWPFGHRNAYVSPITPAGTLLMVPAALEYQSARLPEHSRRTARWLELILDERREERPEERREERPEERPKERMLASREPEPLKTAFAPESPSVSSRAESPSVSSRAAHNDATANDPVVAATDDRSAVLPMTTEEPFLPVSPPSTMRLHATLVTTRRYRDGASIAALRAAAKVVRSHARTRPSANVSNVGGWQSAPDYLMEEPALFKLLYPLVYQAIVEHLAHTLPNTASAAALDVRLSGWANANGRGHSNALHDHADQDWALSGLLYLEDGGDAACRLTLRNPTGAPLAHAQPAPPLAGQAVVFPSWVQHWVPEHWCRMASHCV